MTTSHNSLLLKISFESMLDSVAARPYVGAGFFFVKMTVGAAPIDVTR